MITSLEPAHYVRTPWKNGGGVTVDIAVEGDAWRFGRTPIVAAGPFSDYRGFDRVQVLVAGSGLVLQTQDGEIDVRQPFRPVHFAGETPIVSRLEAGPVEVVNLIGDRSRVSIDLSCLAGTAMIARRPGVHIVYAAMSSCEVAIDAKACKVAAGHAVRIDAGENFLIASRLGTAIVASIVPVARTSD